MRLLHLYYDIMNLYGDYANVSALCRMLDKSGEEYTLDRLSIGDKADLNDYDFIYIGSGTEKNQKLVLDYLKRHKEELRKYIADGKLALFTGNSFEMLGKRLTDCYGKHYDGLGLADFTVREQNKVRMTSDVVYKASFLEAPLVGFVNRCSEIHNLKIHLFSVRMGLGDNVESKNEGIRLNNLFGTQLTGPMLIKNPHFLIYIAALLLGRVPENSYLTHERAGYETTLAELTNRIEAESEI